MELEEDARNFGRLVLLLIKVGRPKLRQFFIDQWNAVKGHQRWTDCERNGHDLLRLLTPLPHELGVIKSGNTLEWSLPLVIKVLLNLEKPLFIKKSRIKAIKYLGELREEVGGERETEIKKAEFEKKWDDACTALCLFGATSKDFKEIKKDMKKMWHDLDPFLRDVLSLEKDILELLPRFYFYRRPRGFQRQGAFGVQLQGDPHRILPQWSSSLTEGSTGVPYYRPWEHDIIPCNSRVDTSDFENQSAFEGEGPSKAGSALRRSGGLQAPPRGHEAFEVLLEDSDGESVFVGQCATPQASELRGPPGRPRGIQYEPEELTIAEEGLKEIDVRSSRVVLPYKESGNEYIFHVASDGAFRWQYFDASEHGFFLEIPPFAVFTLFSSNLRILCSLVTDDFFIPAVGTNETLVSYIVDFDLSFPDVDRKGPVIITLPHSGPDRSLGYETVVKEFDKYQPTYHWREIKEYMPRRENPYSGTNSVQVRVYIPTTLAVVTRPITDRFQVTPRGCVVRSSVCDDVTIEFPEGAVKKTVEGSMKLMLMPKSIPHTQDACPILCVDGLSNVTFSKPVIVKMSIPVNEAEYSKNEIRLLRLENEEMVDGKWEDVTNRTTFLKFKNHTEFHFTHFSCLWPWMSQAKIKFASTIFRYLRSPPRTVCFAAFKDNEEASLQSVPKLTLVCVANHKQYETVCNMKGEGFSRLAVATGDRRMRPNDKAYLRVNGADMKTERFFLRFLKDEVCRKELSVHDKGQESIEEVVLNFFPNLELENLDLILGTLRVSKVVVFSRTREERHLADQIEVEEEAQSLEGAVANAPLMLAEEEEEQDEEIRHLVSRFGEALVNLDANEVAEKLPLYLGVDKNLIADPPPETMQKCQQLCRFLKTNGRRDIVEALRYTLSSGLTGPLLDGNMYVRDLDCATKLKLSRALTAHDEWQIFAEKIDGVTNIDIKYFSTARIANPVLEILNEHCADMKIETLYRLLVESGANAYADFL